MQNFFNHGKYNENQIVIDEEEELIGKLFKDFNYCKQNMSSFTIIIENEMSFEWDAILEIWKAS